VQDDEEVVGELVDLRPLVARRDVLVGERVELEVLLEPGAIERSGTTSTLGSVALGAAVSTRERDGRRSLGFGRFGIRYERVVEKRHRGLGL
jgi:hypothetical protein